MAATGSFTTVASTTYGVEANSTDAVQPETRKARVVYQRPQRQTLRLKPVPTSLRPMKPWSGDAR